MHASDRDFQFARGDHIGERLESSVTLGPRRIHHPGHQPEAAHGEILPRDIHRAHRNRFAGERTIEDQIATRGQKFQEAKRRIARHRIESGDDRRLADGALYLGLPVLNTAVHDMFGAALLEIARRLLVAHDVDDGTALLPAKLIHKSADRGARRRLDDRAGALHHVQKTIGRQRIDEQLAGDLVRDRLRDRIERIGRRNDFFRPVAPSPTG